MRYDQAPGLAWPASKTRIPWKLVIGPGLTAPDAAVKMGRMRSEDGAADVARYAAARRKG